MLQMKLIEKKLYKITISAIRLRLKDLQKSNFGIEEIKAVKQLHKR